MKRILFTLLLGCCLLSAPAAEGAVSHAKHYTNGLGGMKGGSMPGPGFYWRQYHVFYNADRQTTNSGKKAAGDFDGSIYGFVNRAIYITETKILGADWIVDAIVPITNTDLELKVNGNKVVDSNKFGLGDIMVEPLLLAWHGKQWDAIFGVSAYLPTGEFKKSRAANPGKGFTTLMSTFGGTLFFDEEKKWHASAVGRYEIHTKQEQTRVTHGNDFHIDWGVGRNFGGVFDLGLAGYTNWQVTKDSGSNSNDNKVNSYAVGPEVAFMIPSWKLSVSLRSLWEFGNRNAPEGNLTALTFTKAF